MQRVALAAGFTREGVLRGYSFERGHLADDVVFARLPEDAQAVERLAEPGTG